MMNEHEKEIYNQELQISSKNALDLLNKFLQYESRGIDLIWDIVVDGAKHIVVDYRAGIRKPENQIQSGFVEINPSSVHADNPIRIRIVSLRKEMDVWWLNFANLVQASAITPNFPPEVITSISRELITNLGSLPEDPSKPDYSQTDLSASPKLPEKPDDKSNFDAWFEYYFNCQTHGKKYTLKDLATDTGFSYGYIREKHRQYKAKSEKN